MQIPHVHDRLKSPSGPRPNSGPSSIGHKAPTLGARRTGARHDKNLLTRLALCGRCGGSLVGRGGRYICNATGKVHLGIGRDALDRFVNAESSYRHLESPATVADLSEIAPELRDRLAAVEAEQADVVDDDTLSPAFADRRYRKLEAERAELVTATEKSARRCRAERDG